MVFNDAIVKKRRMGLKLCHMLRMASHQTIRNIRIRYLLGLSTIAVLVTVSFFSLQRVVAEQRNFSALVNLAGHQAGLANRIAYFASLMVDSKEESEFDVARSQVGRSINKMRNGYRIVREGDREKNIPIVVNENLRMIYQDPAFGLDTAMSNYLEKAEKIYGRKFGTLTPNSNEYLYLTTYGPHVLEPLLDAVVEEFQIVGHAAISKIEWFELAIWLTTLVVLLLEVFFIFHPLEGQVRKAFERLQSSIDEMQRIQERLVAAQRLAKVGDWQVDLLDGSFHWSDQVLAICGCDNKDIEPSIDQALGCVHADDRHQVKASVLNAIRKTSPSRIEYRIIRPDGSVRLVSQQVIVKRDGIGDPHYLSGTIQDITERRELVNRLEKLSEHIPGFIFQLYWEVDGSPQLLYASRGVSEIFGVAKEQISVEAGSLAEYIHPEDRQHFKEHLVESGTTLQIWHQEYRVLHPKKGVIWVESHATPERLSAGNVLWHGYLCDITERKAAESQIMQLALYDPLTGVANRRLLKERLQHAIATSKRNQNYGAVVMLDLDNFKMLNDTKGHDIGDALLIEVTSRLLQCIRETDTVARLGGDEFVVVLEWLDAEEEESKKQATAVAEKIRANLALPYILGPDKHIHHGSASIGVVVFLDNKIEVSELLKRADLAMYESKDLGRNRVRLFSKRRQDIVYQRTAMVNDIKLAMENREFDLYFQPQLSATQRLVGAELLIRWIAPGKAPVSPGEFIPIAEETGLILPLGEWVLEQACRYLKELSRYPLPVDFGLSVNISARQFSDEFFVNKVKKILSQHRVDVGRLRLELTESSLFQNLERGHAVLSEFQSMGLRVEMDDFGTGYSSLNSLHKLPLSTIKIDKSLVDGIISEDGRGTAIVRAALAMAKAMGMRVIAEGVEKVEQRDFLIREGCDVLQGFLFAKPMPYESFVEYLGFLPDTQRQGENALAPLLGSVRISPLSSDDVNSVRIFDA